jgi:hypothetical protein
MESPHPHLHIKQTFDSQKRDLDRASKRTTQNSTNRRPRPSITQPDELAQTPFGSGGDFNLSLLSKQRTGEPKGKNCVDLGPKIPCRCHYRICLSACLSITIAFLPVADRRRRRHTGTAAWFLGSREVDVWFKREGYTQADRRPSGVESCRGLREARQGSGGNVFRLSRFRQSRSTSPCKFGSRFSESEPRNVDFADSE